MYKKIFFKLRQNQIGKNKNRKEKTIHYEVVLIPKIQAAGFLVLATRAFLLLKKLINKHQLVTNFKCLKKNKQKSEKI
jgi:hypothetical protein